MKAIKLYINHLKTVQAMINHFHLVNRILLCYKVQIKNLY